MFDSSYAKGEPAMFGLNQVVPGWTEALQLMVEGEKRRIWVPEKLAYAGKPGMPAGMLVFEVELVKIAPQMGPMMPPGMGGRPMPGAMGGGPPMPGAMGGRPPMPGAMGGSPPMPGSQPH
jgi:hypothetical protein